MKTRSFASNTAILLSLGVLPATTAWAADAPSDCRKLIAATLPDWQAAPMSAEAVEWAATQHLNPWVAAGDFDGNGVKDRAVLGVLDGRRMVAVCVNPGRRQTLLVIEEPYCSDVIVVTKAGSTLFDFQTGRDRRITHDGISTLCLGQAGATYVLESGRFVQIVDSD